MADWLRSIEREKERRIWDRMWRTQTWTWVTRTIFITNRMNLPGKTITLHIILIDGKFN